MTDYTISSKLSNETVYACYRGRFWRWNGSFWKESHLMTQKFERAKAADKKLTPQAFLTNGAEFAPLDEYEIDCAMLDALENAKPCKNAPIEPVEEDSSSGVPASCICSTCTCGGCKEECFGNCHRCGHPVQECNSYQTEGEKHLTPAHSADVDEPEVPGTQTAQEKPLTTVPDEMRPAFDYSGLDAQTVEDLHFAEDEYRHGKQMAERGLVHMGNAIAAAHDALCDAVVAQCDNGKFAKKEDTFRAWCVSIGITKDTAYRLLQVSALLDGSSPRQQKILKELSPTLLYAVAKPSAPAELVKQVKSGDITTNKQYQEALAQLKAEKERADAAEKSAQNARKENAYFKELVKSAEAQTSKDAERREEAESRYESALADISGLKEQNAKLQQSYHDADESRIAANLQRQKAEAERDKAEARAKNAEGQLSGSRQVAEAAKLRADKLQEENAALKKQPIAAVVDEEEVDRRAGEKAYEIAAGMTADYKAQQEQDARDAYDSIILAGRSITSIVQSAKMQFRKLPNDQRETAINQFVHTLASAQGEVSACL